MSLLEDINANQEQVLRTLRHVRFATVAELALETGVSEGIVERIILRNLWHQGDGEVAGDCYVDEYGDDDAGQTRYQVHFTPDPP